MGENPSGIFPAEAAARVMALHGVLFDQFVRAHTAPPKPVVSDFGTMDVLLHPGPGTPRCAAR